MAKQSSEIPQTEQRRYEVPGIDTNMTTAIPRTTEYDLQPEPSRTAFRMDEQTFRAVKKGNCP